GSQDYDMALRLTDCAEKIIHIPKVLYYWRSHQGSVSANLSSKPYCITSAIDAIEKSVERSGMSGKAEKNAKTVSTYRVKYDIKGNPKVSVIIVSDGKIENVEKTLKSIVEKSQFDNYELILADTERSSKKYDFTLKKYKDFKDFRVAAVSGRQTKYQLCNKVAREAKGEQLLFIDAGCEAYVGGCIREMLMFSQRDDVGAVGAKILAPNKTIRHAGYVLGINGGVASVFFGARYADMGYMYHLCYAQNYNAVSSECMMIKKSVFEKLGGFDESYHSSYSDIDLCLRLRDCGYLNVFTPFAEFVSISKETLQSSQNRRDRQVFSVKWADRLSKPDEYYNTNLSTERNDFSL
ncbi:MAG: glycosyltransferase, partial [Oscillospiraceae bacterium]